MTGLILLGLNAMSQIKRVTLQASGLTCSMCSKAVKTALEDVPFVEKVQVDIKNQQYNLSFKDAAQVELDELSKAVEDAGFSVASLKVTASVENLQVARDQHVKIGNSYFHFLNAAGKLLDGEASFNIVDKAYVPAKEFKKFSGMTKMKCMQTGKSEACCNSGELQAGTRVYHAIL